ncbi:MAG: DUF167 domain-containing protein [Paracoccaceae bacterium]
MRLPDLTHLAIPGRVFRVRVTPRAAREALAAEADHIAVRVTARPAQGKANAAAVKLLARALGVPKTRLTLIRGGTSRTKLFRLD